MYQLDCTYTRVFIIEKSCKRQTLNEDTVSRVFSPTPRDPSRDGVFNKDVHALSVCFGMSRDNC